jgi:hypothetical protein
VNRREKFSEKALENRTLSTIRSQLFTPDSPPPCFAQLVQFNIWFFANLLDMLFGEFFKSFSTKFFIVIFLILQGFIEIIANRLSQTNDRKYDSQLM